MKSIFESSAYNELLDRLKRLDQDSVPLWGKMTVGQMLWHCKFPLKIAIENRKTSSSGNIMARWFFKKSMYSDRPWRKNLPTAPQLKAVDPKSYETEYPELIQLVKAMHDLKERASWNPHPLFGTFTHEQWGQMQYKHLDHHLRQFGV